MSAKYDELAARAERGELKVKPGTDRRGDESRKAAQQLFMDATETNTAEDALRISIGRPPVGAERGESPVIRSRVPQGLKDAVREIMDRENRSESDVVREALTAYIESRRAS